MSIRLGIVGAGSIGRAHAQAARRIGLDLVCVADVNGEAARRLAEDEAIAQSTDDPQALLTSPEIQGIIIAVPNKFHKALAIGALDAGKDVLLEKPMGLNVDECRAINAAANRSNCLLQIGFVRRYETVVSAAKRYVDSGRLGEIYHVQASQCRRRGIPGLGGWFTTKALAGGGALIDLGVHLIDTVLYLMGNVQPLRLSGKVYANFGPRMREYTYENMWAGPPNFDGTFDVEDAAHAFVRFENGATLALAVTWAGNTPDDFPKGITVLGDHAGLSLDPGANALRIITEEEGHNVDTVPKLVPHNNFDRQLQAFVHSIQTRTPPEADGRSGQRVQAVIDAIYRSSQLDREVEIGDSFSGICS